MKRLVALAVLTLLSALIITFVFVKRSSAVPLRFNKKDLPQHGLIIVGQSDQEFAQIRMRMASKPVAEDLGQPYVFIKNTNEKQRVIAYTLKWQMTTDDGRVVTRVRRGCREDLLVGKEGSGNSDDRTTLLPKSVRLFALFGYGDGELVPLDYTAGSRDESGDKRLVEKLNESGVLARANEQLRHTVSVTLSIDGALFEDGSFVGEDTTGHFERLNAQMDAKRNIVRETMRRLKSGGESYESVAKSFEERGSALSAYEMVPASDARAEEVYKYYEKRCLDEILEMRRGFESDEMALRQFLWVNYDNRYLDVRRSAK